MSKRGFGALVIFLVGCATGGAASRLIPPASAQQQTAVNAGQFAQPVFARWEYRCADLGSFPEGATTQANAFGAEGWELVGLAVMPRSDTFCFKRPLPRR